MARPLRSTGRVAPRQHAARQQQRFPARQPATSSRLNVSRSTRRAGVACGSRAISGHSDRSGGAIAAVRAAGGLYIADEVQAGLARTGSGLWGFTRHGIVPDLVTLGKPMGDGHPMAALLARPEHLETFGTRSRYFNTFGGNPVSAAVGLAVLDVIRDEDLMGNAARTGRLIHDGVEALARTFLVIGHVRACGLYMGIEIVSDPGTKAPSAALAARLVNGLRAEGVLVGVSGPQANVLKVRPPLPFGAEEAAIFLDRMGRVLDRLDA